MQFIIKLLMSSATSFLIKLLTAFASEKIFAHTVFSIMEAGAKSTNTEWDDDMVKKLKSEYNKIYDESK